MDKKVTKAAEQGKREKSKTSSSGNQSPSSSSQSRINKALNTKAVQNSPAAKKALLNKLKNQNNNSK